jgi:hypothetical protein
MTQTFQRLDDALEGAGVHLTETDRNGAVPIGPAKLERVGLGWIARFPLAGAQLRVDRIKESRGELHGELTVSTLQGQRDAAPGHVFRGRQNLSSLTSRTTLAKFLKGRLDGPDWQGLVEEFCVAVMEAERGAEPFTKVGNQPRRPIALKLLDPIIFAGVPTILFGPGGTGKSTLAAAIAASVHTGYPVIPDWKPMATPVLVLDWESSDEDWNDLVMGVAAGAGFEPPDIHYRRCYAPLADQVEEIARYITEHHVGLLVVDSVGIASGTRPEGVDANESAIRLFAALRHFRVTSLLIDHVTGADLQAERPIAKPYGSIYKVNLARSVFELTSQKEATEERTELLLTHTKTNQGSRLHPIGLVIEHSGEQIRVYQRPVEDPDLVARLPLADRIFRLLLRGSMPAPQIATELGVKLPTVRQTLNRAQGRRFMKFQDGRWGVPAHE